MPDTFLVKLNKVSSQGVKSALINLSDINFFQDNGNSVGVIFSNKEIIQVAYTMQELESLLSQYLYNEFYSQTTVNAATYTLLENDSHLEVDYTDTGTCTITFPDVQRLSGRIVNVTDTGEGAETYNIIIKDTGGSELFRIEHDKDSLSIRANDDNSKWYIF